jgi:hypothetical protein
MALAATAGIAVRCHRGGPPAPAGALAIDLGCDPPADGAGGATIEIDAERAAGPRPAWRRLQELARLADDEGRTAAAAELRRRADEARRPVARV